MPDTIFEFNTAKTVINKITINEGIFMEHDCVSTGCSGCWGQSMIQKNDFAAFDSFCESKFLNLAKRRFSVRKYRDKPVSAEMINSILEAGRVAPTGANLQPHRIILVQSKEGIGRLSMGAKTCGAPVAFIICSENKKSFERPFDGKSMSDIDASIVTDHMMLEATDLGLGSLWMTYFDPEIIREKFNIPDNLEPVNILLVGYPDQEEASPDRHSVMRKTMDEMVVLELF